MNYFIVLWACETRSQCVSLAPLRAPRNLHSIVFHMLLCPRNHWYLSICFIDNVGFEGGKEWNTLFSYVRETTDPCVHALQSMLVSKAVRKTYLACGNVLKTAFKSTIGLQNNHRPCEKVRKTSLPYIYITIYTYIYVYCDFWLVVRPIFCGVMWNSTMTVTWRGMSF